MKILYKHTHTFLFELSCYQRAGRRRKVYEVVVSITSNYFPLKFLILQSLYQVSHVFFNVSYPSCALEYIMIAEMISGRYLGLTYKGIWLLHIKKRLQYKMNYIKLNN